MLKDGWEFKLAEMHLPLADLEENTSEAVHLENGPSVDLNVLYRPLKPSGNGTGGVLLVTLREATNLPRSDGICDPCIHFKLDQRDAVQSSTQNDTVHPKWSPPEVFELFVEEGDEFELRVSALTDDFLLATCRLNVPKQRVFSHWFAMTREGFDIGSPMISPLATRGPATECVSLRQTPRIRLDLEFLSY